MKHPEKESPTAYEKQRAVHARLLGIEPVYLKEFYVLKKSEQEQHIAKLNLSKEDKNKLERLENLRELNLEYHRKITRKHAEKKRGMAKQKEKEVNSPRENIRKTREKRGAAEGEGKESKGEKTILLLLKQRKFKQIADNIKRLPNKESSVSRLNTFEASIKESCSALKIRVPKEITNAIKAKRSNLPKIQETSSTASNRPARTKRAPQQRRKRQREETEEESSYSPKAKEDNSQEKTSSYNLRERKNPLYAILSSESESDSDHAQKSKKPIPHSRKRKQGATQEESSKDIRPKTEKGGYNLRKKPKLSSYAPSPSESENDSDHTTERTKPTHRPLKQQRRGAEKGSTTRTTSTIEDNAKETPSPTSRSTPLLDSFLDRERTRTSSTPFEQQSLGALDELIVASGLLPKKPQQPSSYTRKFALPYTQQHRSQAITPQKPSDNLPTWQTRVPSTERPNVVTPPIQFQPFFGGNHSSYSFHQPIQIVNITQQPSVVTPPTQFQPFYGGGGRRPIPTNQRPFNLTIPPAPHYYPNQNIGQSQRQASVPTQYAPPPQPSSWQNRVAGQQPLAPAPIPHHYAVPPQPQAPAPTQYAPPQQSLWEKWIERRQQPSVDNSGVPRFHGGAGRFY